MKIPLAIKGWTLATAVLLALGVLGMFWTFGQMAAAAQGRSSSAEVLTDANHFLSNLNNAESDQRGFILTGDASYLLSYTRARAALPLDMAALRSDSLSPAAQAPLDAVEPLLQAKLLELAQSIEARQHDLKSAMLIVSTGRGKALMEAIRVEMGTLLQVEEQTFNQFDASYRQHLRKLYLGIVLTSVLALLYALYFAYAMVRNERQRLGTLLHLETSNLLQTQNDSAALVQTIFNTVEDGILTIHAQGARLESVNPAIEKMFGYSAGELRGQGLDLLIPELDPQQGNAALNYFGAAAMAGQGAGREVLGRRKDGSAFLLEIVLTEMVLRGQHFYTGILRDTSVRRAAEEALRQNGALQSAIFNSANFSSIATDAQGVIQIFNVGAERMLGYTALEVMNKITPAEISDPQEIMARAQTLSEELGVRIQPGFEALVFKATRGIEDIYELTYIRKDGSRFPAVVSVTALRSEDMAIIGYLLIGTDNTARKAVEAERQRLDQVLQDKNVELQLARVEADKANQAKSDFLSSMSHELRSPLNAILGFAQLMESGTPEPSATQAASIGQILRAGWYLLELINEVLDLSLIESGKLSLSIEPMSLSEVLDDCHTLIEPLAEKRHIALHFPPAHGDMFVRGDRTRVKQVIINLLSNAIKYNRDSGQVQVSCLETAAARVRIAVQDTGEGLSADKIAQLFQPFNRLGQEASAGEGTGIGLVVSKRLVELMGGEIGMSSQVGVGSIFWVELDLSAADTLAEADSLPLPLAPSAEVPHGSVRTLLYVEDNRANMELVEQLVARRAGLRLLGAADGMRGVLLARLHLPDLILMDINLPGISGLQALNILRDDPATRHIPVLALSANALPRDIARGMEAGFFRYLTKPVKVAEFMEALDVGLALADAHLHV